MSIHSRETLRLLDDLAVKAAIEVARERDGIVTVKTAEGKAVVIRRLR